MADENLLDLDFTMPGAMPPEPPAAPEPVVEVAPAPTPKLELSLVDVDAPVPAIAVETEVRAAATVPPAPDVAPALLRPVLPAALCEAADLFAAGELIAASRRLETALKAGETLGEYAPRTWLALCDVLQALDRRDTFEKIALAYATRFETSPPAWREQEKHADTGPARCGGFSLPSTLDAGAGDTLRELMKLASANALVEIDAGAVTQLDDNGCTLLLRVFEALRKAGRAYRMTHAEHFVSTLRAHVEVGVPSHEPAWLVLLDVLQRVGPLTAFEDEAVNYAISFEVSPPSWNPQLVVAGDVAVDAAANLSQVLPVSPPSGRGLLDGVVSGLDQASAESALGKDSAAGTLELDATLMTRIDVASARVLMAALQAKANGRGVQINGLAQLPWVTLTVLEFDRIAVLNLRKY